MCKKTKIMVIKTFGKEDLQKILKKFIRNNLTEAQITENDNLRGDV